MPVTVVFDMLGIPRDGAALVAKASRSALPGCGGPAQVCYGQRGAVGVGARQVVDVDVHERDARVGWRW
jgi:hypothetical protein